MNFKNYFFKIIFFGTFLYFGCDNTINQVQNSNGIEISSNNGQGVIQFNNTTHNFGKISEGERVTYTFLFENVGSSDLIINDVKTSCGCTTPEWTKEPVMPEGKGKIVVTFDSGGRSGNQKKVITIYTNSTKKQPEYLTITAEII